MCRKCSIYALFQRFRKMKMGKKREDFFLFPCYNGSVGNRQRRSYYRRDRRPRRSFDKMRNKAFRTVREAGPYVYHCKIVCCQTIKIKTGGVTIMTRKQFTFYRSFYESIEKLPTKKEKLQAYEMICEYALYGNLPKEEGKKSSTLAIFSVCQPILNRARQRSFRTLTEASLSQQDIDIDKDKD